MIGRAGSSSSGSSTCGGGGGGVACAELMGIRAGSIEDTGVGALDMDAPSDFSTGGGKSVVECFPTVHGGML